MLSFTLEDIFLRAGLRPTSIPTILAFDRVARNIRRGWNNIVHTVWSVSVVSSTWLDMNRYCRKSSLLRELILLNLSIRFHWIILEFKDMLICLRRVSIQCLQKFEKFARVQMFVKDIPISSFFRCLLFVLSPSIINNTLSCRYAACSDTSKLFDPTHKTCKT